MVQNKNIIDIALLGDIEFIRDTYVFFVTHLQQLCHVKLIICDDDVSLIVNNADISIISLESFIHSDISNIDRLVLSKSKDTTYLIETHKVREACVQNSIQIFEIDKYHFISKVPTFESKTLAYDLDILLNRSVNHLDIERISSQLDDARIVITGAAGSIGSEIVKQLARYNCNEICLIDQAESPLFSIQQELQELYPDIKFRYFVSDVTLKNRMDFIIREFAPSIIFHAAAYKHVPLMEQQPYESIRVNIGGVVNLAEIAIKYNVRRFVMISSDKAVNPSNVMGACKRVCELYIQALSQDPNCLTNFIITRFGNVLGSNGSVVPLFVNQILKGGPIKITSNLISRYFMTIREACELVLEAGLVGKKGEIFIFDMGPPVKIIDLAIKMIHFFGLRPYEDIEIEEIGLRPGEKLFEELFGSMEHRLPTHNSKIFISRVDPIKAHLVISSVRQLLSEIDTLNSEDLVKHIKSIVLNYISKNSPFIHLDREIESKEKANE